MGLAAIAAAAQAAEAADAADAAQRRSPPSPPPSSLTYPPRLSSTRSQKKTQASSPSSSFSLSAPAPPPSVRPLSSSSDTTAGDTDAFESDSSVHLSPNSAQQPPSPAAPIPLLKKRRAPDGPPPPPSKARKPGVPVKPAPNSSSASLDTPDSFPASVLLDLAGSTSAEVRRMNDDERALVHYKRRLRNRESAKRSRARRQATIGDIQSELEDLRSLTAGLVDRCMAFARTSERQSQEIETLRKEKQLLESLLRSSGDAVL